MAIRFLSERLRRNGKLSVEDWFDPYLKDFVPMARSKGVELFNEKLDGYSIRQDVIDDILLVMKYEEKLPEVRRKSYLKVAHDMVLWHFVNDKRPAYIESPIDANHWILTVDFRFIGFDAHKQKFSKSKVPLCIHPTSLIQLLQFWIPRTKEFEEAMLGSLRLPFLFQEFDAEAERTSLKILKGIGRFEGNEELSQDTITHVMLNDGLRSRLQGESTEEAEMALIRDALVEEVKRLAESEAQKAICLQEEVLKRDSALAALVAQKQTVEQENVQTKKQKEEAEAAVAMAEASVSHTKAELAAAHEEKSKLAGTLQQTNQTISDLQARLSAIETEKARNRKIWRVVGSIVLTLVGWATVWWLPAIQNWNWLQTHTHKNSLYFAALLLIPGMAWAIFGWKGRLWVLSGVVLAVVIRLIGVL
jgi:hypothetical protein